jgi:hypothetical protein
MDNICALWQEEEISMPNKPVAVPSGFLFSGKTASKNIVLKVEDAIKLKQHESTISGESTSTNSGRSGSEEEETTKTTATLAKVYREVGDCEPDKDDVAAGMQGACAAIAF